MDPYRNDYGEVCVYCHTPHGASTGVTVQGEAVKLPLWNRTQKNTVYTTYDQLNTSTLTQTVTTPGANSLSCLSCHDGTTAVDSIINMPGSGRYQVSQRNAQDNAFLDTWPNAAGSHVGLDGVTEANGCLACHSPSAGVVGTGATDFRIFAIGTDLRNDHPVGITFPTGNPDFWPTTGSVAQADFFDKNGNGRMDSNDIRLYKVGGTPEVECASCHDPHGVPSGGPGTSTPFNPTFLRVSNAESALCLTCHVK